MLEAVDSTLERVHDFEAIRRRKGEQILCEVADRYASRRRA